MLKIRASDILKRKVADHNTRNETIMFLITRFIPKQR